MGIGGACEAAGILALTNVFHHRVEVGLRSYQSHASAPRPSPPMLRAFTIVKLSLIERTTRPCLELLHDLSRREIRDRHDDVDVLRAAVDGMQIPAPKTADSCDGDFDGAAFRIRQRDARRLQTPGDRSPEAVLGSPLAATGIGPAAWVARKPRSVGCPREEERDRIGADDRSGVGSHATSVRAYTLACQAEIGAGVGRDRSAYVVTLPAGRDRTAYAVTLPEAAIGAPTRLRFLRPRSER